MRFYSRLDDAQCQRLHEATLRVLERTGLIVDEPEGLELLRRAGAAVDGNRVRVPAKLVDWALSVAPKEATLYGRDGQPASAAAPSSRTSSRRRASRTPARTSTS